MIQVLYHLQERHPRTIIVIAARQWPNADLNRPFCLENCFLSNFPLGSQVARPPSFGSLRGGTSLSFCRSASCPPPRLPSFGLPCAGALTLCSPFCISASGSRSPSRGGISASCTMPCLAICPWPQRLGVCGGGFFSPNNELDASGALG